MLREDLMDIIKLTEDQSYSHAARMIEIKRKAKTIIHEIDAAAAKSGTLLSEKKPGPEVRNPAPQPPAATTAKATL